MRDAQYARLRYFPPQIDHRYGDAVHILADPLALNLLAQLCAKGTVQPRVNQLVKRLYTTLLHHVVAAEFPVADLEVPTRMIDVVPEGVWRGPAIDAATRAVVVAVARAGIMPSQVAYDYLNETVAPEGVRQDHLSLARETDAAGKVTGAALGAAKIGGDVDGAFLLIPDPMGATGSTITRVLAHYREHVAGTPRRVLALHLIVTPEYLRHVTANHPDVSVWAFRLDRGLSPADVLATVPGERWDNERGLTDQHYIVPGGGGLGEVMNNSYC
ncbi:MAG: uracil phosphoribosyltransferase [Deltaproteobacteria bacterium]|nr:MAG: uracil phosphoribosyltransferase [Deltaproteobacteria bacterium]